MKAREIISLLQQIEEMTAVIDEVIWVVKVHNKEVLMTIIHTNEDWRVREVAIRCLKDKALLELIMREYSEESTNYRFAEECLVDLKANLANLTNR